VLSISNECMSSIYFVEATSVALTSLQKIIVPLNYSLCYLKGATDVLQQRSNGHSLLSPGVPQVSILNSEKSLSGPRIKRKFSSKLLLVIWLSLRMNAAWSQNFTKSIGDIMKAFPLQVDH
jgi:hypothetical protein